MENVQFDFKALRSKLRLTQNEIASKLEWTVQQWQKLEYKTTPDPRASTIYHICKKLDISADTVLGLKNESE